MTLGAESAEVFRSRFCALTRIQTHRRIERVELQLLIERVMNSGAGKALNQA